MDANRLVSHRGDNTNYPENSYAAIESALKAGALFIEFDIQMNADKSLVLIHDIDFKRTAGAEGLLFESSDINLESISVHEPKRFIERHQPTKIPFLTDILNLFDQYPKAHAFIEIKVESLNHWGLLTVMDKLLEVLRNYQTQATIISYNHEALAYTQVNSKLQTGLVFNKHNKETKELAYKLKPNYLICPELNTPRKNLWKGNWKWMVYSINNTKKMQQILKRENIELVETDNILLMLKT